MRVLNFFVVRSGRARMIASTALGVAKVTGSSILHAYTCILFCGFRFGRIAPCIGLHYSGFTRLPKSCLSPLPQHRSSHI